MELDKYLESIEKKKFADDLGISVNSLFQYRNGERLTPLDIAVDIVDKTNGKVKIKDLLKTWKDKHG
jgi:DNA-binding transcriptional regulator YdaS (Cro superfamily)